MALASPRLLPRPPRRESDQVFVVWLFAFLTLIAVAIAVFTILQK